MKRWLLALGLMLSLGLTAPLAVSAQSVDVFEICEDVPDAAVCEASSDEDTNLPNMVTIGINTLLIVLGMVSVVMIVVGGIRYASSAGEPAEIKRAKDTILYSIVGVIVAIMAFAIVNFVLERF